MKKIKKNKPALHAVMASPMRLEMVGYMNEPEPLSISDLARRLGRPATSLYHHIQILLEAEVIREAGTRPKGKRYETLYELTDKVLDLDIDRADPDATQNASSAITAALRMAGKDFEAGIARTDIPQDGSLREVFATRMHIRATDEVLEEINRRLDDLYGYILGLDPGQFQPTPDDRFVSLTMLLAPLRGRRPGTDKGEEK